MMCVCLCVSEREKKKEGVKVWMHVFLCDKMLRVFLVVHFITDLLYLPHSPVLSTGVSVTAL